MKNVRGRMEVCWPTNVRSKISQYKGNIKARMRVYVQKTKNDAMYWKNIEFLNACDNVNIANKILLSAKINLVSESEIKNLKISRAFELFENL